jgi:hypothetical protein
MIAPQLASTEWKIPARIKRLSIFSVMGAFAILSLGSSLAAREPLRDNVNDGLKVSANRRYLVNARTGRPVFLLADTAWNLNALSYNEIDSYLKSRADNGFNAVMFALNFYPQAEEKNAYGQPAYLGADKTGLNPEYFAYCDALVKKCAARGLYVMLYSMWGGTKAGTMNRYDAAQLHALGKKLGAKYKNQKNVILVAGGEASPPYIDVERVNAMGGGMKEGSEGNNLVTVHPCSTHSSSEFFASSTWLDFSLCQVKSGKDGAPFDVAKYIAKDYELSIVKPTMVGEHRYESGTMEDPVIQRRPLYVSVFAGGFGYAYGHNALWQMTPHTAQKWMLKSWNPGVSKWPEALNTKAAGQLRHIETLLYSRPYLQRIPDQSLVLSGQGNDVAGRIQATRDGAPGKNDASYIMAYLSSPKTVTLKTSAIAASKLNAYWFDPETGLSEAIQMNFRNPGSYTLEKRPRGQDGVILIEDASKRYPPLPSQKPAQ